ncbi:odorant receptor 9a [Drosophila tropicalis]|uniref:odorant receptor 9a n=1 Tax=Drosophila tropicalis TaxID=46794 RepID=UPI0035ABFD4E
MDDTYFLRVQIFVFSIMGIDLWHARPHKDRQWWTFITMGLLAAFLVPMFFAARNNVTNVSLMSDAMGSLVASSLTVIKYILFLYYRKEFVGLIYRIRDILDQELTVWPDASVIIEEENRNDQLLSLTYTRCYILAGVFASTKPVVIMAVEYLRWGSIELELPHKGAYPWDINSMWYYVPTYFWNVAASYSAVTMALCVDTLLFSFTYNVCAIFKIAKHRVIHLSAMEQSSNGELSALIQILQLHQKALHISQQLSSYYRPLIFMQFFASALQLCFLGYQVADLFPKPLSIYFISFGGSILIALFIYSHCGENIKKTSIEFADGIYESNWMDFAPSTKKVLLIAAMRSQRPCNMDGYFFEASMATFSAIVRTAMSYIMMLRSFSA